MLALGQDEIAKYPFLADAGQYLKDKGFTLEQFGTDPDLKSLVEKAWKNLSL
jgi:DNA primase large subunit